MFAAVCAAGCNKGEPAEKETFTVRRYYGR